MPPEPEEPEPEEPEVPDELEVPEVLEVEVLEVEVLEVEVLEELEPAEESEVLDVVDCTEEPPSLEATPLEGTVDPLPLQALSRAAAATRPTTAVARAE